MKRIARTAAALLLATGLTAGTVPAASAAFNDVPRTHWAYSYITQAADEGLVKGTDTTMGLYSPEAKLNTAEFVTMLSALLYPSAEKAYAGVSSYWWYSYMEYAHTQGLLEGTTVGNRRTADKRFTATVVEAGMSRYDLAQIAYNISRDQGWEAPSSTAIILAMASIADWSSIPTGYQNAVSYCYAKGFLSGQNDGYFNGSSTMTRAEAAVVLCQLMDARDEVDAPEYTNRDGKLVNGEDATEDNVADMLKDLEYDYSSYDVWNVDRTYTSAQLGSATGDEGFVYMLSDKIFGRAAVRTVSDPERMKVGDVIYLRSAGQYGLVQSVSRTTFEYVTCDSKGVISWDNEEYLDELGSRDTLYTRYEGEGDGLLANGDEITERNVAGAIDDFLRDYDEGDRWYEDDEYRSDAFDSGRVYGNEAFAYFASDEIFGQLEVLELSDPYQLLAGDVVYLDDDDLYVFVLDVDTRNDEFEYLYADEWDEELYRDWGYLDDLDRHDILYTRYPDSYRDDDGRDSRDGTLSNGDEPTVRNVRRLIEDLDLEWYVGTTWASDERHRSDVFPSARGSEAFAYFISDEIFDQLDYYDHTDFDEIREGDVVYLYDDDLYGVVIEVDDSDDTFYLLYADEEKEKVNAAWKYWEDLDRHDDVVYTRYP